MKSILLFCFCVLNFYSVEAQQNDAVFFYAYSGWAPNYYSSSNQIYTSSFLTSGGEILNGRTMRHNLMYSNQVAFGDYLSSDYVQFKQAMYNFQIGIKGKHQIDFSMANVVNNDGWRYISNTSSVPLTLKYHYQLLNDKYYFQVAPTASLIYRKQDDWNNKKISEMYGYDVTIPISKKIEKHFSLRYNVGLTQFFNYEYTLNVYRSGVIASEKRNPVLLKNGLNITYIIKNKWLFLVEAEHRNFNHYYFDTNQIFQSQNRTKWQRNVGVTYVSNIKKSKLIYSLSVPQFLNKNEMGIILGVAFQHKY
jgi:hypothetical protein